MVWDEPRFAWKITSLCGIIQYIFCKKDTRNFLFKNSVVHVLKKILLVKLTNVLNCHAEFEHNLSSSLFTAVVYVSRPQVCLRFFQWLKTVEQRICLKFCIANKISYAEALKMLGKVYGKSCISKT